VTRYAAIYCRISEDKLGRREGVDAQEQWGRDYAASAWPGVPVRVFADNDISAANGDHRAGYEQLLQALDRGEVAHLWAVEQSRLERREVEWFQLAALLDGAGITELHTNRDGIVRVRDEVAGIKAVLAAGEVRKLKRRINDRLDAIAAEGRPAGSVVFGYRHALDAAGAKTLEPIPEQADVIREAAQKVVGGWSLSNIAAELRARGLRGAHGGKLTSGSVLKMVTNPTVAGHRVHRGRIIGRGVWPPILDEDVWQACRAKLGTDRRVRRSDGGDYPIKVTRIAVPPGRKYLLTGGLARCGVCGKALVGSLKQLKGDGGRSKPYLLCHPSRGGRACVGIVLPETEAHVVAVLFDELDKPEFLDLIAADDHADRRGALTDALRDTERQRDELAALWATPGELTTSEWQTARRALAEHEQQLRADLAAVPPPLVNVDIEMARSAWPVMTLDEKREFLRLFIANVTIRRATPGTRGFDPGRVAIEWRTL
jgi:DNA invertase Pin-like site-specific DNA recombinase